MNFLIVVSTLIAFASAKPLAGYVVPAVPHYLPAPIYPYTPGAMAPVAAAPNGIKAQYYSQDIAGGVSYGFADPTQSESVIQDAAGNKVGSFTFINGEGKLVQANYIADTLGYRVASNDLPVTAQERPKPAEELAKQPAEEPVEITEARARIQKYEQSQKDQNQQGSERQTPSANSKSEQSPSSSWTSTDGIPIAFASPPVAPVAPVPLPHLPLYAPYPYGYPIHYPYQVVLNQ